VLKVLLGLLSAVFALAAAYFWFRSAATRIGPPKVGWGGVIPEGDDFMTAFSHGMKMNRIGAAFAACSAVTQAILVLYDLFAS
jgi:hypothetical protein